MCAVQLLRVSVHERMSAAAAELLLRLEAGGGAAELPALRALLTERLTAAAEEIVALLEETVAEYEERLERKERELRGQRRLLDAVLKPQVLLSRADVPLPVEVKQEERSSSPEEDPSSAPPLIKEEQQEAEISQFSFSPVGVKSEEEEEKPQLHHGVQSGGGGGAGGAAAGGAAGGAAGSPKQECESWSPSEAETCSFCGKRFGSGGEVTRHMWLHAGEEVLRCVVCHRGFPGEEQLLAHRCGARRRPASPPRAAFGCPLCHRSFGSRGELSEHAAAHVTCSVCGAAFADTDTLILHMRGHGAQTQFSCTVCGKDFAWRRHLARHLEVHRDKKVHRYSICRRTLCRRRTRLGQRRCVHRPGPAHEHQGDEQAACSPAHHHQLHAAPEPRPPEPNGEDLAPQSDDSVDSDFWKDDRKRRAPPSDEQQPEAAAAAAAEVPPAEVSVDVDGSSGGEAAVQKRFACSQCGKSFQYGYLLRRHGRTHTGEKPYACGVCRKRFSQKENLAYHMGLHTGHKRFGCPVCQRRFNWLSGVKRHICVPEGDEGGGGDEGPGPGPGLGPGLGPG